MRIRGAYPVRLTILFRYFVVDGYIHPLCWKRYFCLCKICKMKINANTVQEYLDQLPQERRETVGKVRNMILENLPEGYEEGIQYGMIGYFVPLSIYPKGYLEDKKTPLPYIGLASQKNHMSLYLNCIYAKQDLYSWFTEEYKKTGKKMEIGKSCVRFKKLEDLPLSLVGRAVAKIPVREYIDIYEESRK